MVNQSANQDYRVDDNDSLRDKVDEAVKVFNEYVQKQGGAPGEGDNTTTNTEANGENAPES